MINYHPCFKVTQKRELYVPFIYEGITILTLLFILANQGAVTEVLSLNNYATLTVIKARNIIVELLYTK